MKNDLKLWILTGCTGVGKTEISLHLAKYLNADILSCDSIQVYKGADIGSAKISIENRENIVHYGIDICNLNKSFDVALYQNYAQKIIRKLSKGRKNLLIVGGTGFYLKSFFSSVLDSIYVSPEIQNNVNLLFQSDGIIALQNAIKSYGSVDLNESDWNNPRRLCNILCKQIATGLPQKDIKKNFLTQVSPFDCFEKKVIFLENNDEILLNKIKKRTEKMFSDGFLKEVTDLQEKYKNSLCLPLRNAIGYREILNFVGKYGNKFISYDVENLQKEIVASTFKLVKKQKTWFKKQIPIDFVVNFEKYSFNEGLGLIYSFCRES